MLDGYGGVWFYTTNKAFYSVPNPQPQTESPIGSLEGHLSYDFNKLHCWASLDGNFWFGGTTSLNGISNPTTRQTSSRIGATVSIPLVKHQSIKISYSNGTYVRFGGNYQSVVCGLAVFVDRLAEISRAVAISKPKYGPNLLQR